MPSGDEVSFFSGIVAGAVVALAQPGNPLAPTDFKSFHSGYVAGGVVAMSVTLAASASNPSYTPIGLRRPATAFLLPFLGGVAVSTLAELLLSAVLGRPTSK